MRRLKHSNLLILFHILFLIFSLNPFSVIAESKQSNADDEPYVVNLQSSNSSVHFHQKYPWVLQGIFVKDVPLHKWQVELKYNTWSERGRLFTIVADSPQKFTVFTLEVSLFNGMVNLKLTDEDDKILMNEDTPTTIITDVPHEGTVGLEIDAENSVINFNENIYIIGGKLFISEEQHDLEMKLFLGKYRDSTPSVIGCIELLNFGDLSASKKEIPEVVSTIDVSLNCPGTDQDGRSDESEKVFKLDTSLEAKNNTAIFEDNYLAQNQDIQDSELPSENASVLNDPTNDEGYNLTVPNEPEPAMPIVPRPPARRPELSCQPGEKTQCDNYQPCIHERDAEDFKCVCHEGYGGRYCQFSLFPRTCSDAFDFHGATKSGVYEIDVDGSGPLLATHIECRLTPTIYPNDTPGEKVVSIVSHNLHNGTLVRSPVDKHSKYFPVIYKLFSPAQLKALMERSNDCSQTIRYVCDNSPLNFDHNMTWFEAISDENARLNKLGSKEKDYNCDHISQPGVDENIFIGTDAGISAVYLRKNDPEGTAHMTLGELKCKREHGKSEDYSLTLMAETSSVHLFFDGSDKPLHEIEFDFRTNQKEIGALFSGKSKDDSQMEMQISLKMGHRLELIVTSHDETQNITKTNISTMSQTKLNDLQWHRVLVEVYRGEIRLAIDNTNSFLMIPFSLPSSLNFTFGSTANENGEVTTGWTGCIRNFRVNGRLQSASGKLSLSENAARGCPNRCAAHSCEQDSRCIQHFDTDEISCECKNIHIHKGERCEKNVNKNSDVSFHDGAGYLKYLDEQLPGNPLNSGIVFSFRTDQKDALLVYAHDQYDNIIQVHLADEYRIVLTLNNESEILRCTVYATGNREFNDMRWIQIIVEQYEDRVSLSVDDNVCEITGKHFLAQQKIAAYTGELEDAILPPQSAGPVVAVKPYNVFFVGGVPSVQTRNIHKSATVKDLHSPQSGHSPYAQNRIKRERIAYYVTDIPSLLGCMRGVMVNGASLNLRKGGIRPADPDAIRVGCYNDCDSLVCHNGGHCTVHWQNYDPFNRELTGCDCTKTSYDGPNCLKGEIIYPKLSSYIKLFEDTGVTFTGDSSIVFDMTEPKRFFLHESTDQLYKFAFSPAETNPENDQHLSTVYFSDGREFHVIIAKNGSVITSIYNSNGQPHHSLIFPHNHTDGYRHFFQATFSIHSPISDEAKEDYAGHNIFTDSDNARSLISPDEMLIHRREAGLITTDGPHNNSTSAESIQQTEAPQEIGVELYQGCMSNIEIDFKRNEAVHFRPLVYYNKPKELYYKSVRNDPRNARILDSAQCAGFKVVGALPTQQRDVQFPIWEAPSFPLPFDDELEAAMNAVPANQDIILPWWLWLVLLLVLWLILFIMLCCCLRMHCGRSRKNRGSSAGKHPNVEERVILHQANNGKPVMNSPIRLIYRSPHEQNKENGHPTYFVFPDKAPEEHPPEVPDHLPHSHPYRPHPIKQTSVDPPSISPSAPSTSTSPKESVSESSTLYYTAQEYPYASDNSSGLDDFEDVDSVLAHGFDEGNILTDDTSRTVTIDRSNPSRMSSFGTNDQPRGRSPVQGSPRRSSSRSPTRKDSSSHGSHALHGSRLAISMINQRPL
ncbi:laminin G domain-containing protein [Ditylenchus destructor]|uniref:Laminin G domain-containing protein n=1 Tax=Ditylenchus destructor TaxID=166010 RepID=A0AAD4N4B3_9BILA|nr:laminin G domain-containing protein [Ditylenchus destructor]